MAWGRQGISSIDIIIIIHTTIVVVVQHCPIASTTPTIRIPVGDSKQCRGAILLEVVYLEGGQWGRGG